MLLAGLLLGLVFFVPGAQATAGDLDPGFGSGGKVVTDFGATEEAHAAIIQPDGKIVAAGCSFNSEHRGALARYNPDGTLDGGFGAGGKVTSANINCVESLALQPDGKIVAVGEFDDSFVLLRFGVDGSPDASFGVSGRVTTSVGANSFAGGLVLQPDGKLVVAGFAQLPSVFVLARYMPDGTLDTFFGSGGIVTSNIGGGASGLALQPDGKLVAAGGGGNQVGFLLARFSPDGTLDTTFGQGGTVSTAFGTGQASADASSVAIQPDGKIVAAGAANGLGSDFGLARYNPDGSLDTAFGSGGKVTTDFAGYPDHAEGLVIEPGGKIAAAGPVQAPTDDFGLAQYNSDGSLDTSFGSSGKVETSFGELGAAAHAILLQPDGKLIVAGDAFSTAEGNNFALVRYLENQPPTCTAVSASPSSMQPATADQMKLITLSGATDPDGGTLSYHIDAVSQDEPVTGIADETSPDAELTSAGADSNQVLVRAERNAQLNGRVYRIAYTVSDGQGGSCSGTAGVGGTTSATVSVLRKKDQPAIDDGDTASWNSFTGAQASGPLP